MNDGIEKTVSIAVGVAKQKRVQLAELQTAVESDDHERLKRAAKKYLRTNDGQEESDRATSG